ncbi:class I mannose-6-phosphate isomerase [Winogradskyella sp. DF17]|uniref:Phosphohexomutase n=1 Tax=Winogradskyella pelagia TaxID=2819984 RepID=A0ABS3T0X3_9FLAO|nr:type I phosphomannose isomerase catalytic subunit [Winogradskyella sp. DF17]MBO3116387.1 class I mannose-6-phosphate isomerase [Winogradskyella sp. DF17]
MNAYPIKFRPILKEKIWGGEKLSLLLNKETMSKNIGESWEISGVEENISIVANGLYKGISLNDLIKKFKGDFLGQANICAFGENFPLLIKFLDAQTNLSVQVHPDDKMASKYHNSYGKTEMWYIMDAEKDAEIVLGLKDKSIDKSVLKDINASNVNSIFNNRPVKKGESYFIPAGEIHAIGAGILAAEIQQTSDITYRVYDWEREDINGNMRKLHTEKAIEATKVFPNDSVKEDHSTDDKHTKLVSCDFFTTNAFYVNGIEVKDYKLLDSFVIYMCVEGNANVKIGEYQELVKMGETILIPARAKRVEIASKHSKFLEVYIPSPSLNLTQKAS